MCEKCGCRKKTAEHHHPHDHDHPHDHQHPHDHDHAPSRTVVVQENILSRNDEVAQRNRQWLTDRKVTALNLISSPGSGKTTLLEKTLEQIADSIPCAVIAGDQCTDRDSRRLVVELVVASPY